MVFRQQLGQLRAAVSTYAALPVSGNELGDLRITTDIGSLYTWMSSSTNGLLSDWKKVTVSSYNDLVNRPSSSVLAINDATQSYTRVAFNFSWLCFIYTINQAIARLKLVGGIIDKFVNTDNINLVLSSNYIRFSNLFQNLGLPAIYYISPKRANFDDYVKILLHGNEVVMNNNFYDFLKNNWASSAVSVNYDVTKFGNGSMRFGGNDPDYILTSNYVIGSVENQDFTFDFWVNIVGDGLQPFFKTGGICIYRNADGNLQANLTYLDGIAPDDSGIISYASVIGTSVIANNEWVHIAVERQNGYIKIFVNGILEGTSTTSDIHDMQNNDTVHIGCNGEGMGSTFFQGYIEEFRYSLGVARYTSNFTPMTIPYNYSASTVPMTLVSNGMEADSIPTSARISIYEEDNIEAVDPNTDLQAFISRDGGTTFTQVTLERISDMPEYLFHNSNMSLWNIFAGTVDLSSQPNGKEIVYKIVGQTAKDFRLCSVAINWK